jgi:hypothetical protein
MGGLDLGWLDPVLGDPVGVDRFLGVPLYRHVYRFHSYI